MLKEPRILFVKYDLFPYIVHYKLKGWTDEGFAEVEGGYCYAQSSIITTLPEPDGSKVATLIDNIENDYRTQHEELKRTLLAKLYNSAPSLKIKKEK
jgi:hypothetical protein